MAAALWRKSLAGHRVTDRRRQGFRAGGRTKLKAGLMLARAALRPEDRGEVGALGQPRLKRCAREPQEGAAVPRSLARSLAPPKPRTPASRSPGRGGAARSGAASGFSSHRRRGSGGAEGEGRGSQELGGGGLGSETWGRLSIRGRGECARKPWWAEGRQCCGVGVGNSVRRPKRRDDSGL